MADNLSLLLVAVLGGALRIGTPLMFAALGDCLTQRCGRLNLGLEGIVACAAVAAVAATNTSGTPWAGLGAALLVGILLAAVHWACCALPRVDDLAAGIALLVFGVGAARYAGSDLGATIPSSLPAVELDLGLPGAPLEINLLLPAGLALALAVAWLLANTGAGIVMTVTGSRALAARLLGVPPELVRLAGTLAGGAGGGVAGACLALHYPGGWSDYLASGVGITAIALVFLARTRPLLAVLAAFMFAAAAALGPALQALGGTGGYHLLVILPYLFTIALLAVTARNREGLLIAGHGR